MITAYNPKLKATPFYRELLIRDSTPPINPFRADLATIDRIKAVRHEISKRRFRYMDPSLENRKRKHNQTDKTVFTDFLLHHIARCGKCGWHLGIASPKSKKVDGEYRYKYKYYICRGENKGKCDLGRIHADELDANVWMRFVGTLSDPKKVERMILKQNFIIDEELDEQKNQYETVKKDIVDYRGIIERTKQMYQLGHKTIDEYNQDMTKFEGLLNEAQERKSKLAQIIKRPKAVRNAVKKSTKFVANQLAAFRDLGEIEESVKAANNFLTLALNNPALHSSEFGPEEQRKARSKVVEAIKMKDKMLDASIEIVEAIRKKRQTIVDDRDFKNLNFQQLIFQQQHAMLKMYINRSEDKGIRAFDANIFTLNFSVRPDLFNYFGDKKGEDKKTD